MTKRALETRTLKLEGMTCSACVNSIERALNNLEGVSATVNFASETAHILAPADISTKKLIETVKGAGYSAQLLGDSNQFALHSKRSAIALFFALLFSVPSVAVTLFVEVVKENVAERTGATIVLFPSFTVISILTRFSSCCP